MNLNVAIRHYGCWVTKHNDLYDAKICWALF